MTEFSVDELLQQGKQAANAHDNAQARRLLSQVVRRDPTSEQGWLWLSGVVEDPERIRYCLERVLAINPDNIHAAQALEDFAALTVPAPTTSVGLSSSTTPLTSAQRVPAAAAPPAAPRGHPGLSGSPPARPVRRRPDSMVEGGSVHTVVVQHSRVMWAYIALWCGIMALNVLVFKAGAAPELSFPAAIGRAVVAGLVLAVLQCAAWAVLVRLLDRRTAGQALPHTSLHAAVSQAIWPSALIGLAALVLAAGGAWAGDGWQELGSIARILLLLGAAAALVRSLQALAPDAITRRASPAVSRTLAVFGLLLGLSIAVGWTAIEALL
jgi:hypothetical protein